MLRRFKKKQESLNISRRRTGYREEIEKAMDDIESKEKENRRRRDVKRGG